MNGHPVRAAWDALGQPGPRTGRGSGLCSLCGIHAPVTPARTIVSDKFTDWDQYPGTPDPAWCPACVWSYSDATLRTRPWLVTPGHAEQVDQDALAALLAAPLPSGVALTVPISRHKHLLPRARYGVITTDDAHLPWGPAQVRMTEHVSTLRALGFGEKALLEPTPRWALMRDLTPTDIATAMDCWTALAPWREARLYMDVALRATRGKVPTDA